MKLTVAAIILLSSIATSFAGNFTPIPKNKIAQACNDACQNAFDLCVRLNVPPPSTAANGRHPTNNANSTSGKGQLSGGPNSLFIDLPGEPARLRATMLLTGILYALSHAVKASSPETFARGERARPRLPAR